jgi:exosome complex exonuclease RRP6
MMRGLCQVNANRSMPDPEVIPSAAETTSGTQSGPTGQVEIPFVPAAQRRPAHMVDDAIIVVGQARQKKRKRYNVSIAQDLESEVVPLPGMDFDTLADGNQSKKSYNKKRQDEDLSANPQEPFDYSSVPNILDDIPTPEPGSTVRKKKKQKQSKGELFPFVCSSITYSAKDGVMQYGNFPAPPKAHRELKSGNQSYTFK